MFNVTIGYAGTIVDDMVELLCANLQKDDLAAINASLSADDTTDAAKEALLKVRCSTCTLFVIRSLLEALLLHHHRNVSRLMVCHLIVEVSTIYLHGLCIYYILHHSGTTVLITKFFFQVNQPAITFSIRLFKPTGSLIVEMKLSRVYMHGSKSMQGNKLDNTCCGYPAAAITAMFVATHAQV